MVLVKACLSILLIRGPRDRLTVGYRGAAGLSHNVGRGLEATLLQVSHGTLKFRPKTQVLRFVVHTKQTDERKLDAVHLLHDFLLAAKHYKQ